MPIAEPRPIMIVEDSDDDYEATERALKKDGRLLNPLLRFENGESALAYLLCGQPGADTLSPPIPSIILLDLNMPGGGGLLALSRIKANEGLAHIPVIVLTTSDDETDIAKCYSAGANTYIKKPVQMENFVNAIQQLRDYWLDLAILPAEKT